jgi:RNA polymerase sigma-70 factor, ECF subfamily
MAATVSTRLPDQGEERIREFISHDFARVVAGLAVVCGSKAVAEDVVQEALARAWEQEMEGQRVDSLAAWIRTVALNLARSRRRRLLVEVRARQRLQRALETAQGSGGALDMADRQLDLVRSINRLPQRQREVVALTYFMDLDGREVAQSLGMSEGGVRALLFRARKNLASALEHRNGPDVEEESPDATA